MVVDRLVMAMTRGEPWARHLSRPPLWDSRHRRQDHGVRATNNGTTAATNAFLLVNTGGTGFRRTDDDFEFSSYRVTASYRF